MEAESYGQKPPRASDKDLFCEGTIQSKLSRDISFKVSPAKRVPQNDLHLKINAVSIDRTLGITFEYLR